MDQEFAQEVLQTLREASQDQREEMQFMLSSTLRARHELQQAMAEQSRQLQDAMADQSRQLREVLQHIGTANKEAMAEQSRQLREVLQHMGTANLERTANFEQRDAHFAGQQQFQQVGNL